MLGAVAVIVLEVIALIFECVESLVLNFPSRPSGAHERLNRAGVERDVGNPGPASEVGFFVGLLVEQVVDLEINGTVRQ